MRIHRRTDLSLDDLARWLNPIVSGWMTYYGRFYRTAFDPLLRRVNAYLRRWAARKYKRLRTNQRYKQVAVRTAPSRQLGLSTHWRQVRNVLKTDQKSPVTETVTRRFSAVGVSAGPAVGAALSAVTRRWTAV